MTYTPILVAAGGALAVNLLNLAEALNLPKDQRPDFCDLAHWVPYLIFPLLGAFVAYVYVASDYDIKPVLALQLGASAPLIIKAAASAIPRPTKPSLHPPGA